MRIISVVSLTAVLVISRSAHAQWAGFTDQSNPLRTDRFDFSGTKPEAGDTNENYYDGDFADIDGDGRLDRGMISRYGLLWNSGGGILLPVANTVFGATYRFGDKDAIGNDAVTWADIDNDGDYDSIQGGNGESFTAQTNSATRFAIKWQKSGSSAKRIIKTDLDRDGDVDIVAAGVFCLTRNCGQPDDFTVWLNDGMGNYSDVTDARGLSYQAGLVAGLASGDVDGDGDFDMVIFSGTRRRGIVLLNNGSGTFTEREFFTIPDALWTYDQGGQPSVGMSGGDTIALGDLDNDGDLDLVTSAQGPIGGHPRVFYALFMNDGAGNFTEQSATKFDVGTFAGKLYGSEVKLADLDADGDLDLTAYMQSAQADIMGQNLQVFLNDGTGRLVFAPGKTPAFTPPVGGINAFDVADYTGDGAVDLWVGNQGGRVMTLVNTYTDPNGIPADMPRNATVVSSTAAGIKLSWNPPISASQVRFYRVYRSTTVGLPTRDRVLVKTVALSRHADEGFVAPITKFTTAAQLADPDVTIGPSDGTITWTDRTATPGITYQYSIVHVGNETKASAPTTELAATIPGPSGTDTMPPELTIVSPTRQHWAAFPRIVLQYADAQTPIDPTTLRVSFNSALGTRAADVDISDLGQWKDARSFVAMLGPPYALPVNTLVTMTASVKDTAGNTATATVQYFVATTSPQLPTAAFTATPQSGDAPIDVTFDGNTSTDVDSKVVQYEWSFGDGTFATGATATHRYNFGGAFVTTLIVRDTQGGVGTTTKMITTTGAAPECGNGEVRACYSGPDGTVNVSSCVAGMQTCASGAWAAECAGEVAPAVEVCDDGLDNDCDGEVDDVDPDCGGAGANDPGGCGCRTSGSVPAGAVLFVVTLALGRRRRKTTR